MARCAVIPYASQARIALLLSLDWGFARQVFRGAAEVCIEHHLPRLIVSPDLNPAHLDLRAMQLQGVIGTLAGRKAMIDALARHRIPAINVSGLTLTPKTPQIIPDNLEVGRCAARHLLEQGVAAFACVGPSGTHFSEERFKGFTETLAAAGLAAASPPRRRPILEWLGQMPRPVGLFCSSDQIAANMIRDLPLAGLRVPEDVRVVGVDNDEVLCQTSDPPLTSVDCAWEQVGRIAARHLIAWLQTGQRPPALTQVTPAGLIIRQSSNLATTGDPVVDAALRLIRQSAPRGLGMKELLAHIGMSRSGIEARFAKVGRSTPAAEILQVQFEHACRLLGDTHLPLKRVAQESGLGDLRHLRAVFHRKVGQTPTAYRARFRGG